MRQFRVGIGDMRNVVGARFRGQAEQHGPDDDPGLIAGQMGELAFARDIANGIDALVGAAQVRADFTPPRSCFTFARSRSSLSRLGLRPTATSRCVPVKIVPPLTCTSIAPARPDTFSTCAPFDNVRCLRPAGCPARRRRRRVVAAHGLRAFDHRHLGPQAPMRQRHFQPDGAAADDQQWPGQACWSKMVSLVR